MSVKKPNILFIYFKYVSNKFLMIIDFYIRLCIFYLKLLCNRAATNSFDDDESCSSQANIWR